MKRPLQEANFLAQHRTGFQISPPCSFCLGLGRQVLAPSQAIFLAQLTAQPELGIFRLCPFLYLGMANRQPEREHPVPHWARSDSLPYLQRPLAKCSASEYFSGFLI